MSQPERGETEKFITAVNSIKGAQVTQKQSGDPGSKPVTILLIKRKNRSQEEMFQAAKQAINALLACVNANEDNE